MRKAYGNVEISFGREYLIPKPFDPRVLLHVAPAVAKAAMDSGVARRPIADMEKYKEHLEALQGRSKEIMRTLINKAKAAPKRVVFPEGEEEKILRAAQILVDEKIAVPRITSYNVCYTKLLRWRNGCHAGDAPRSRGRPGRDERVSRESERRRPRRRCP